VQIRFARKIEVRQRPNSSSYLAPAPAFFATSSLHLPVLFSDAYLQLESSVYQQSVKISLNMGTVFVVSATLSRRPSSTLPLTPRRFSCATDFLVGGCVLQVCDCLCVFLRDTADIVRPQPSSSLIAWVWASISRRTNTCVLPSLEGLSRCKA